jgi:hypothetical protein
MTTAIPDALHSGLDFLGSAGPLDWTLVVLALGLLAWGWIPAVADARLGTIEVRDLAVDGPAFTPAAVKAALHQTLAKRGWLPASGIPSGSPTVKALGGALAEAPVGGAKWIGALISVIPTPPASTSFKVSGTLSTVGSGSDERLRLSYQLDCLGPVPSIKLDEVVEAGWPDVVEQASKGIYLAIAAAAPGIYPEWARWHNAAALTSYRRGLDLERRARAPGAAREPAPERYAELLQCYREASERDPRNELARLRAANCLERMAGGRSGAERAGSRLDALELYTRVGQEEPTILEARLRAGVLLSTLADALPSEDRRPALRAVLERLEPEPGPDLAAACRHAARRESRRARRLLRPLAPILHEGRFRHRFEVAGRERRQLRKALGMSLMCQRARRAGKPRAQPVSDLTQLAWQAWVFARYFAGRSAIAGWQSHYNAACFYALLPHAADPRTPFGSARVRERALRHLRAAIRQADDELSCTYVRDEDADLDVLRSGSREAFERAVSRLCAAGAPLP